MSKYDKLELVRGLTALAAAVVVVVGAVIVGFSMQFSPNLFLVGAIALAAAIGVPTYFNPELCDLVLGKESSEDLPNDLGDKP